VTTAFYTWISDYGQTLNSTIWRFEMSVYYYYYYQVDSYDVFVLLHLNSSNYVTLPWNGDMLIEPIINEDLVYL